MIGLWRLKWLCAGGESALEKRLGFSVAALVVPIPRQVVEAPNHIRMICALRILSDPQQLPFKWLGNGVLALGLVRRCSVGED